jgi:hypothetical protein
MNPEPNHEILLKWKSIFPPAGKIPPDSEFGIEREWIALEKDIDEDTSDFEDAIIYLRLWVKFHSMDKNKLYFEDTLIYHPKWKSDDGIWSQAATCAVKFMWVRKSETQ